MIKLPEEYTEYTFWNLQKSSSKGVFARIWFKSKIIEYYPRWWMAPAWPLIRYYVTKHERSHAWGLSKCLSDSKLCVMFEDNDT